MDRRTNEHARPGSAPDARDSETGPELDEGLQDVRCRATAECEVSEGS